MFSLLLLLSVCVWNVSALTEHYNDMVGDVLQGGETYYGLLGVESDATVDAVKKAYRKLAASSHPDKSTEADATDRFQRIQRAYSVLKDSDARGEYDFLLAHGVPIVDRVGRQAQILTRDIGLGPALLMALLLFTGVHWALKWSDYQRTVRAMESSADYDRLRAQFLKKRGLKISQADDYSKPFELRKEIYAAVREFEKEVRDELQQKCAPTWRDLLPVRLALMLRDYYRRSKRSPAEVELENAQRRGLTLGEYRRRLGEFALELARQGLLQPYIAQAGSSVPQLIGDDDDNVDGNGNETQDGDDDDKEN
jgi:curved DNA-binding protein CbpA